MVAIIFITILLLAVTALLVSYRGRRLPKGKEANNLGPRNFDGLFAEELAAAARELARAEAELLAARDRRRLIQRAAEGDRTALDDAHSRNDPELYRDALRTLAAQFEGDSEHLLSTARYIIDRRSLRSTADFTQTMIGIWSVSLDQNSLVDLIYLSALSDDAAVFLHAVELASGQWHQGKLPRVSAKHFLTTVESAYWLIAAEVRNSGSGFMIKRAIADLRRELAAAC